MLELIDKIAMIERGIEGMSVYLIKISYLGNNAMGLSKNNLSFSLSYCV